MSTSAETNYSVMPPFEKVWYGYPGHKYAHIAHLIKQMHQNYKLGTRQYTIYRCCQAIFNRAEGGYRGVCSQIDVSTESAVFIFSSKFIYPPPPPPPPHTHTKTHMERLGDN